jgi:two-component system phosphate regulon sensor histidine kinase PhoR
MYMGGGALIAGLVFPVAVSMETGTILGALLWLATDQWRQRQLLDWLRQFAESSDSEPQGVDKEIVLRVRRLLRQKNREANSYKSRLDNLQAMLQAMPNGVIVLDAQERIEWCNRVACEHFGLDARRDMRQRVTHLLRVPALVRALAARDMNNAFVVDGPLSSASNPLRLEMRLFSFGQAQRVLMLSRDITTIEQAEAMRRDFVANVSHEIRTPLTVLSGFVETLQTLALTSEERKYYLALMAEQSDRMTKLVEDLLTLSRMEGSSPPDMQEWTPLSRLFRMTMENARALSVLLSETETPGHQIVEEGLETSMEISGSVRELSSAFSNLVHNALRYTPQGGRIFVRWQPNGEGGARFSVEDSGLGIAPEHLPRLTERFYRIDADRSRNSGGTGLGLSIVKHAAQRHGAKLLIRSALGHGSCFSLDFPAERLRLPNRG